MPARDLVLLTGATGMVGFRILVRLLESGYYVRAAVRTQAGFDRIRALPTVHKYANQLSSIVVPEITQRLAYFEAIRGAKFVVHVASPISCPNLTSEGDYHEHIIRPAMQGTTNLLEAAHCAKSVKRVVITGSLMSIVSNKKRLTSGVLIDGNYTHKASQTAPRAEDAKHECSQLSVLLLILCFPTYLTENTLDVDLNGSINQSNAYIRSKALAFASIRIFMAEKRPRFTVANILPVLILGRDDEFTNMTTIRFKGANSLLLGPLLGIHNNIAAMMGNSVHLDDVAELHVRALDAPLTMESETFIAAAGPMNWSDCFDIVKRRFPKEYAEGVFPFYDIVRPTTSVLNVDNSKAKRLLGREFKTFEEQVVSVVEQYLELRERTTLSRNVEGLPSGAYGRASERMR
ncbi:hypothetical protein E4U47_005961 [Claviceps purpurea]|nr:hypothetical protein E4U47_005961 [Claviceps purpurea]